MAKKRKKKGISVAVIITVVCLSVMAVIFYYISQEKASFVYHAGFGIEMPVNYSIHGIDVSKHQSKIHWKAVHEMSVNNIKLGFVFIKATEGVNDIDKAFKRNWKQAKEAGMYTGAYHFFISGKSGKAQAVNFIKTVELKSGDLPPVLDVEEAYGMPATEIRQRVADWLFLVERAYKVKPIIYTNIDFYKTYLARNFEDYPLWIAHYEQKERPRISRSWSFWQHNESGLVNGINAKVDFNVFNGDSSEFRQLLLQ